jgi:DNA polymerase-3 subunit epsilon
VICNESRPAHGKGYLARELGVPVVSDAKFMDSVATVVSGTDVEEFVDSARAGDQFALF